MAAIDDLIGQIEDRALRERIAREVAELQRSRKFGLVFEQHLPELLPVYSAKPQRGDLVARRTGSLAETWLVLKVERDRLQGVKRGAKEPESLQTRDVVVVRQFGDPIFPSLVPMGRVQNGPTEGPWHTLIEADNYHALQLLEYLYAGQVDCIYIDPPYNTGARDWKYNNDYVDANDAWRHSKWLAMMRRRLAIASRLLKVDGVLIVTIDEHEVHHLGMLLEELFPKHLRHVVSIVINPKGTGKHNFARVDEYAIFVVPALGRSVIKGISAPGLAPSEEPEDDDEESEAEAETDEEENGDTEAASELPFPEDELDQWELRHARRRGSESSYRPQRPNQFYALYINEQTRKVVKAGPSLPLGAKPDARKVDGLRPIYPIDAEGHERCWRVIPDKMNEFIGDKRVVLGKYNTERDTWTVNIWYPRAASKKLKTVWWETRHDAGTHGTTLLYKMLGRRGAFPFPKSLYAVRDCLAAVVRDRPNALIVDFFAGSGTTLHATALLNRADDGKRRCILVTNNEVSEKQAAALTKEGLSPADEEWAKHGICRSVAIPRCLAAITGKRPDGKHVNAEYLTGRFRRMSAPRVIKHVTLGNGNFGNTALRKELVALVGLTQSKVGAEPWHIEEGEEIAILWDVEQAADFAKTLKKKGGSAKTILVPTDRQHFNGARQTLQGLLPPREWVDEETLPIADGLPENFEYFQLDFLDKDQVALKQRFPQILPLLWMRAGCVGMRPEIATRKASPPYVIPTSGNFAVLLEEMQFRAFKKELKARDSLSHVFIVTDSHEAFEEMAAQLSVPKMIQLYRDYVENFMINKGERA